MAGVLAKLDRADEHLASLDAEARAFVDTKPHVVRGHIDKEASQYIGCVEVRSDPPQRLSIIAGDFVHNMRSALDLLLCQLIVLSGSTVTNAHSFPILTTRNERLFKQRTAGLALGLLGGVREVQPYNAGDHAADDRLAVLHELSCEDKHRSILATTTALAWQEQATLAPVIHSDIEGVTGYHVVTGKSLRDGDKVLWIDLTIAGDNPNMHMQGYLVVEVAFGERLTTVEGLGRVRDYVRQIVCEGLQPLFGS